VKTLNFGGRVVPQPTLGGNSSSSLLLWSLEMSDPNVDAPADTPALVLKTF